MAANGQRRRDDHTPFVYLTDKYLTPQVIVSGYLSLKVNDKVNGAGTVTLEVPGDHQIVDLVMPHLAFDGDPNSTLRKLTDIQQFLVVEYGHDRYTYFVDKIIDHSGRNTPSVEIVGTSIYDMANYLVMESNPISVKAIQPKYMDVRAGDSLRVIKTFILMNLRRLYQFDLLPDLDPWSPIAWRDYADWPIMVNPLHKSTTTPWTVLAARFDSLADLTQETLEAAGLRLVIELWMPWDKQPFPTHTTLWKPTFIVDVVPLTNDSSVAGHIREGVKNIERFWDPVDNVSTVHMSNRANRDGYKPWIMLRPNHIDYATSDVTITRSQYADVTVGGKSPGAINKLLKRATASFAAGAIAGLKNSWPGHDKQLDALGDKVKKASSALTEDKLLAFTHHQATKRAFNLGPYRRRELVASGEGFTVEGEQQAYEALAKGRGTMSAAFKLSDDCPYQLGYHVHVGDQIGCEWRGMVLSTWVDEATISHEGEGTPVKTELALGDAKSRRSALQQLNENQKHIASVTKRLKTIIG
ncbi:hypothetical protein [Corynebacterium amycolatum]|uniref:Gp37-like protein n=1 Tax=Corynebacterium amycolatum TaxID=43765 RepID=UPI00191F1BB1|nr:hypothetical protein [Corynebacterium amycolatum]QQU97775.1 hypothetical protein I6I65_10660 [Corynebacterium amycolatum]